MAQQNTQKNEQSKLLGGNGRLRCYNMYPREYDNFAAMKDDVQRIAEMNHNAVWINPVYEVGDACQPSRNSKDFDPETRKLPKDDPSLTRSLYAMKDYKKLNPEFVTNKEASPEVQMRELRDLVSEIKKHGMQPMCDIAFSHLAIDSPYVTGEADVRDENGNQIDTKRWFKHYKGGELDGQPVREGINENNQVTAFNDDGTPNWKMVWPDIAKFDYSDPAIREEIFEHFWRPFIDQQVALGFTGIRIDSIAQNQRDVLDPMLNYFKEQVHKKNKIDDAKIIIFGETLSSDSGLEQYQKTGVLNYFYSGISWAHGKYFTVTGAMDKRPYESLWHDQQVPGGSNWVSQRDGDLEAHIIGNKAAHGGAVGYTGCVDDTPALQGYGININEYPHNARMQKIMREKMAQTMLWPNGGHFLFAHEEWLPQNGGDSDGNLSLHRRSVFANHSRGEYYGNLEQYVTDLNTMIANLSPNQQGAWATRRICKSNEDLVVIERHESAGYAGPTDVMIASAAPEEKDLTLTDERMLDLVNQIRIHDPNNPDGRAPSLEEFKQALKGEHPMLRVQAESRLHKALGIEPSPKVAAATAMAASCPVAAQAPVRLI